MSSVLYGEDGFVADILSAKTLRKSLNPRLDNLGVFDKEENKCGKNVVKTAKKYLGTGYGGTGKCSPEDAQAGKCTTQCGSYVTNVFRYALGDPVWGNGNQKCAVSENVSSNRFFNPESLQPGDIFSSDGQSQAARKFGHTGIYVGKGTVSEVAKKTPQGEPYCYSEFEKDPSGEHVFIHSIGPVCYSTFRQLLSPDVQGRDIISFCRHEKCETEDSSITSVKGRSGMTIIEYNESTMQPFICRDSVDTFAFTAEISSYPGKSIGFSVRLHDTMAPDNVESVTAYQSFCFANPSVLFSWKDDQEDVYAYNITVSEKGADNTMHYTVPVSHARAKNMGRKGTNFPEFMSSFHTLHKPTVEEEYGDKKVYHYQIGSTGSNILFKNDTTYEYEIKPLDAHLNTPSVGKQGKFTIDTSIIKEDVAKKITGSRVFARYATNVAKKALKMECSNYYTTLQQQYSSIFYDLGEIEVRKGSEFRIGVI